MKGLVYKQSNSLISLTGNAYTNPQNYGTARLCVKKGTDTVKFGLTTHTSATQYCGIRMKINGNTAYIGRIDSGITTSQGSSSSSSSWNAHSTWDEYSRVDYQTFSVSTWVATRESWYDSIVQKESTGTSKYEYKTTTANGTTVTSPYSRTVNVTATKKTHGIDFYTYSDVNANVEKTHSFTEEVFSSSTHRTGNGGSWGGTSAKSTSLYRTSFQTHQDGKYYVFQTISSVGLTSYARNYPTATYHSSTVMDFKSVSVESCTTAYILLGYDSKSVSNSSCYDVISYKHPNTKYFSWPPVRLIKSKSFSFTESQVGKTKTAGNWYDASTLKNNTYTATRKACARYTAVSAGVVKTLTKEVVVSEEHKTTSRWQETVRTTRQSNYEAASTDYWNTYSIKTINHTDYYTTSSASTDYYQYQTITSTHNYNI